MITTATEATETASAGAESAADGSEVAQATTETTETATSGQEALGDAGKQALDRMKAERKAARDEAAALKAERDALQAKIDGTEAEHKAQADQKARDDAALAKANERILKAEVRAAAAGKLNDPADALRFLDLSGVEVGDDGEVDGGAIAALIADLIEKKPYLAAQGGTRFEGGADGGARKESAPAQVTKAEVQRMYAEGKVEEIEALRVAGRLDKALGIKS